MGEDCSGRTCEEVPDARGWLLTSSEEATKGHPSAASVVSLRQPEVHANHIFLHVVKLLSWAPASFLCLLPITRKKRRSPLLRLPRQCSRSEALSRLHTSQRTKRHALLLECVETTISSRTSFRASQSLLRSCARQGCKTCPLNAGTKVSRNVQKVQPCTPMTKVLCILSSTQYYTGQILRQLDCNNL